MKESRSEKRKRRKAEKEAKRKQPKTAVDVPLEKRPVPGPSIPDDADATIVFRLSLMDNGGPWSFAGLSADHVELIASTCKGFESLKRGELMGRPGNKPITYEKMIPEARNRAQHIGLDSYDGMMWELRLGGEERLWGLLDGHCFYIVWWDPDHEICPSTKKHT